MVNEVKRIYSNDEILWVNMSRKDIEDGYSYMKECFDEADTNGDDKIDRKELDAYNKKISIYLWDEEGEKEGIAKCVFPGTTKEEAYSDKTKKRMFDKINTDNDDKLSYEEVNTYALNVLRETELSAYNSRHNEKQKENQDKVANIGATSLGIVGLFAGLLVFGHARSDVRRILEWRVLGTAIGALAFGGIYLGDKAGRAIGKLLFNDEKNWQKSFDKEYEPPKQAPKGDYEFLDDIK